MGLAITFATYYAVNAWVESVLQEEDEEHQSHAENVQQDKQRIKKDAEQEASGANTEDEEGDGGWQRATGDDMEDDEDYEDDEVALLFFPTGFSRPKPRTFYKGTDPEWQEFIKIASDRTRIDQIRGELVGTIRGIAVKIPQWKQALGEINSKKGSVWIEVFFPDAPPIEYEQPGWMLTTDLTLRPATQDVDQKVHSLLGKVLAPTAVAKSVYEDSWRRATRIWQDTKKNMGWEEKSSPDTVQKIVSSINPIPPAADASPSPTASASPPSPTSTPPNQQSSTVSPVSSSKEPSIEAFGLPLPTMAVPTMDIRFFHGTWKKNRKHDPPVAPRGAVIVSGLIDIVGEKAKMTLDVYAAYDPKARKYVLIDIKLRSMKQWQQSPKGGPG